VALCPTRDGDKKIFGDLLDNVDMRGNWNSCGKIPLAVAWETGTGICIV
jgi:hypothetical protein